MSLLISLTGCHEQNNPTISDTVSMTPAQRAAYLDVQADQFEISCRKIEKDFGIRILYTCITDEARPFAIKFIKACYKQPLTAQKIGILLENTYIEFNHPVWFENDKPKINSGMILFPAIDKWTSPANVLKYLETPLPKT